MERLQKLARQVLGEEIQKLKDPRVGFATVTAVRITSDLRHARVLVSVFGTPEESRDTMAGLDSAKPHLRSELGRQTRMKYLPELDFELDTGPQQAQKLDEIFDRIHSQQPQGDEETE